MYCVVFYIQYLSTDYTLQCSQDLTQRDLSNGHKVQHQPTTYGATRQSMTMIECSFITPFFRHSHVNWRFVRPRNSSGVGGQQGWRVATAHHLARLRLARGRFINWTFSWFRIPPSQLAWHGRHGTNVDGDVPLVASPSVPARTVA